MFFGVSYQENVNNEVTKSLMDAITERGHRVKPFRLQDIAAHLPDRFVHLEDEDVSDLNGLVVRTIGFGTGDQITYRISLLEHMELAGIYVMNPAYSFRRAKDKYATLVTLQHAGIRVPRTFVGENLEAAVQFVNDVKDVVVKPMIGSRGMGALRPEVPELTYRALKFIHQLGQILYVQEYIKKPDRDIRAFVVGGRLIGAMYRYVKDASNEWRTNVYEGGKAVATRLESEYEECAIRTADILKLDYTGVDMIETPNGPCVIEANAAPSWSALSSVTGVDVAGAIADLLIEKSRR
ncbi:MAG: RimK family alpha-L-glutamate ligase [Candidatus Thorarchaeota archaeon]